jgi:hypothetical protein
MRWDRALWVALGVLGLTFAAFLLYQRGPSGLGAWYPGCLFHRFTGLHCPGCGMTRAAYAALHGNFGQAFRMNPVGMILLPLACVGLSLELLGWVRGRPPAFRLDPGYKGSWTIAFVVIAFWVLRNIPAWPFDLLAPY